MNRTEITKENLEQIREIVNSHTTLEELREFNSLCLSLVENDETPGWLIIELMEIQNMIGDRVDQILKDNNNNGKII